MDSSCNPKVSGGSSLARSDPPGSPSFTLATGGKPRRRRCDACGADPAIERGVVRRVDGPTIVGRFCIECIAEQVNAGGTFESGLRRIG